MPLVAVTRLRNAQENQSIVLMMSSSPNLMFVVHPGVLVIDQSIALVRAQIVQKIHTTLAKFVVLRKIGAMPENTAMETLLNVHLMFSCHRAELMTEAATEAMTDGN